MIAAAEPGMARVVAALAMARSHALLFSLVTALALSTTTAQAARQAAAAAPPPITPSPILGAPAKAAPRDGATKAFPAAVPAIELGLKWLLAHQHADGHWDADEFMALDGDRTDGAGRPAHDIAVTGLVLFALAREGMAPAGDGRRAPLERGAAWLLAQQQPKGLLGTDSTRDFIYNHAIGTLGLCSMAFVTGSAAGRDGAQKALDHLAQHRNPYMVWRYRPRDGDNDSSVTTWAVLATLLGHELGLPVDRAAFDAVRGWFEAVTTETGHAGYSRRGQVSSRRQGNHGQRFPTEHGEAMTAAALLCRTTLGETAATTPVLARSAELLLARPPSWQPDDGRVDTCYWFFASEALRRFGGDARGPWTQQLVDALVKGQRGDGAFAGSFDPIDVWGEDGGRVYTTAMAVLALQGTYTPPAAGK